MTPTIILITGATSGVGYATAKVLASASTDYHIIITGRTLLKAAAAKSSIEASGIQGHLSAIQLEVTDKSSISNTVAFVGQKFGHLDVLINNAGVSSKDPDLQTRLRLSFDTNAIGPALISEAFRSLLLKSARPYSIYVGTGLASMANASDPGNPYKRIPLADGYKASKAAMNMIALQESWNFADSPMKTFVFCPGLVRSHLRGTKEEEISMRGLAGDPEDSGWGLLAIIEGRRDEDAGKFVKDDGIWPW